MVVESGPARIIEIDREGNLVREVKLKVDSRSVHSVLEVTPAKEVVWKVGQRDLEGITLAWVTQVARLPNGNTRLVNCHAGPDNPQIIEVTPEKQVVWTFRDFTTFGNSTPVAVVLDP